MMEDKTMRRSTISALCFSCLLLASLTMGTGSVSFGDPFPQWSSDADRYELRAFQEFLSNHPWIANKLWEKPSRANDREFLEGNKELRFWLQDHPLVREEFRQDARAFMDRVRDFERYGWNGGDRRWDSDREIASFERFLDDHPRVAQDLRRNPSLANNGDYLEDHKELRDFLRDHPGIREELRVNPRAVM
jgi:phage-related protein